MQINFYPDCDRKEVETVTEEYKNLWEEKGELIEKSVEEVSGLKFKEKYINAVVYRSSLVPRSFPLSLQAIISEEDKLGLLVHELIHRLLSGNDVKIEYEIHKVVDLILFDVWEKVGGEGFAQRMVEKEKSFDNKAYKRAWEWALKLSKEERSKKFKEVLGNSS